MARADFKLAVGAVSERVEVQEQMTVLETEQGRVSGRLSEMQLRELPINGIEVGAVADVNWGGLKAETQ